MPVSLTAGAAAFITLCSLLVTSNGTMYSRVLMASHTTLPCSNQRVTPRYGFSLGVAMARFIAHNPAKDGDASNFTTTKLIPNPGIYTCVYDHIHLSDVPIN